MRLPSKRTEFPMRSLGRSEVERPMERKNWSLGRMVFSGLILRTMGKRLTRRDNWSSENPKVLRRLRTALG